MKTRINKIRTLYGTPIKEDPQAKLIINTWIDEDILEIIKNILSQAKLDGSGLFIAERGSVKGFISTKDGFL